MNQNEAPKKIIHGLLAQVLESKVGAIQLQNPCYFSVAVQRIFIHDEEVFDKQIKLSKVIMLALQNSKAGSSQGQFDQ